MQNFELNKKNAPRARSHAYDLDVPDFCLFWTSSLSVEGVNRPDEKFDHTIQKVVKSLSRKRQHSKMS